jgi:hypothetical protein
MIGIGQRSRCGARRQDAGSIRPSRVLPIPAARNDEQAAAIETVALNPFE